MESQLTNDIDKKEKKKAYQKAYREAHKEEQDIKKKVYREKNKKEIKEYRDQHKEDKKRWRANSIKNGTCPNHKGVPLVPGNLTCQLCLDRYKENNTKRRAKALENGMCPGHIKRPVMPGHKMCKQCVEKGRETSKKNAKKYIESGVCRGHPGRPAAPGRKSCEECLKIQSQKSKIRNARLKIEVIAAYGGPRCACPGCGDPEPGLAFLSIDHINNDGAEHRRQIKETMHPWLKKNSYPSGFQVLCFNCNFGKNINGGVCPHVKPKEYNGIR